jgi:hypothetical protein
VLPKPVRHQYVPQTTATIPHAQRAGSQENSDDSCFELNVRYAIHAKRPSIAREAITNPMCTECSAVEQLCISVQARESSARSHAPSRSVEERKSEIIPPNAIRPSVTAVTAIQTIEAAAYHPTHPRAGGFERRKAGAYFSDKAAANPLTMERT